MNKYSALKERFVDSFDGFGFINLDKSKSAYFKIRQALFKPLKLILFYGKPGSGKSFLLGKLAHDLAHERVLYLPQPHYTEAGFFSDLYSRICELEPSLDTSLNPAEYYEFISCFDLDKLKSNPIAIMLDEAQLYPTLLIEKIRLLSDTRCFKFLFTVHKTAVGEDILAQEHFTTRIWETIELNESSESEIALYITKKLEDSSYFNNKEIKLLCTLCKGNLRSLNMLLYTYFEICEFYEAEQPGKLSAKGSKQKIIEMSAISKGLLNA